MSDEEQTTEVGQCATDCNDSSSGSLSQDLRVEVLQEQLPNCDTNLDYEESDDDDAHSGRMMEQSPPNEVVPAMNQPYAGNVVDQNPANQLDQVEGMQGPQSGQVPNNFAPQNPNLNQTLEHQIEESFVTKENRSQIENLGYSKLKVIIANSLWTDEKIPSILGLGQSTQLREFFASLGKSEVIRKAHACGIVVHLKKLQSKKLTVYLSEGSLPDTLVPLNHEVTQNEPLPDMIARGEVE